ncbi:MAG: biopolymer transporter ExbD [Pirellulaceae bacterium]|nr:biopolymer transporter ExbD [Pirellulaceae bacterium]MDP7017581.1 biopolymer transporter ExbD [Pirellulaceae bacterium]
MKIRNTDGEGEKIELQMTPMIDIVFQLLIFFIMTFKIVSQEGDFNIKMPLQASSGAADDTLPPMTLRLHADAAGNLANIVLGERSYGTDINGVHLWIVNYIGDDTGPSPRQETAEVELDCDYNLRYEHVIAAVTAVSGYVDPNDNVVKLVEKIKFAPQRDP